MPNHENWVSCGESICKVEHLKRVFPRSRQTPANNYKLALMEVVLKNKCPYRQVVIQSTKLYPAPFPTKTFLENDQRTSTTTPAANKMSEWL